MNDLRCVKSPSAATLSSACALLISGAEPSPRSPVMQAAPDAVTQSLFGAANPRSLLATPQVDLVAAARNSTAQKTRVSIIPRPNSMQLGHGEFRLSRQTVFVATGEARAEAEALAAALRQSTGYELAVQEQAATGAQVVQLRLDPTLKSELGEEGYKLDVSPRGVTIIAAGKAGLFYGGQTLRQLLPPAINGSTQITQAAWLAPSVQITDRPRFEFRGALIDPARNFITTDEMKRFIDGMAFHKLNRLHIHFTDDQGWRLPIEPNEEELRQANETLRTTLKLSPQEFEKVKLTRGEFDNLITVGSMRRQTMIGRDGTKFNGETRYDGTPHGGHYTREQIAELVAYARARHIEIVPEVEMPGHSGAAIASNPGLGNFPQRRLEVSQVWGVHKPTLNPSERSIAFMKVVLDKVMQMFPDSQYIHIGGDEAPKDEWKESQQLQKKIAELTRAGRLQDVLREGPLDNEEHLQAYLVREMAKFIASRGRILAAWDEVLDAEVPLPKDKVAVWLWRDIQRGVDAARAGHPVIMVPTDRTYYDAPPIDDPDEPIGQPGIRTVESAYLFNREPDPVPDNLKPEESKNIRGTIAAIWGEHTYDFDTLQYFTWTRLPAFSEAAWTDERLTEAPNAFPEFQRNMKIQQQRFDALGLRYKRPEHPRTRIRDLPQ